MLTSIDAFIAVLDGRSRSLSKSMDVAGSNSLAPTCFCNKSFDTYRSTYSSRGRKKGNAFLIHPCEIEMSRKYSLEYIDRLFGRTDYDALVELASAVWSWSGLRKDAPFDGLPEAIFAFLETLTWASSSIRSGAITYYEVVTDARQRATLEVLQQHAPLEVADAYRRGMQVWDDKQEVCAIDDWIKRNETLVIDWQWKLLNEHREQVNGLLG